MKYSPRMVLLVILCVLVQNVSGQGFLNLDFESARVTSAPSGYTPWDAFNPISATNALPGWTVLEDGTICTAVWGAPVSLDETSVALVAAGYSPISGGYSVQLSAFADAPPGYFQNSSISQTGAIPLGSRSILFSMASRAGSVQPNPILTVNGTAISLSLVFQSAGLSTMAGDVSAFAGSTVTLSFLCQATRGGLFPANENIFNLDDIQFSSQVVPEPSTICMLGIGIMFLAWRFWKRPINALHRTAICVWDIAVDSRVFYLSDCGVR